VAEEAGRMTGELIPVGDNMLVWVYELEVRQGVRRPVAEAWLRDAAAHTTFYERRHFEGRLYGRVGTRRYETNDEARVQQGEHALAAQTFRQAGLEPQRISNGRAWL